MKRYIRPLVQTGPMRPEAALPLAGGWTWCTHAEVLIRNAPSKIVPLSALTPEEYAALHTPRADIGNIAFAAPVVMGILNVTPDSFSDGGAHNQLDQAVPAAQKMLQEGAQIIDIGGESTRPGAAYVAVEDEIARTAPVINALDGEKINAMISIDTRKSEVARAALKSGATLVNDVSGFTFDPALIGVARTHQAAVCVMHAQGDPATMQDAPQYEDVVLDVYDFLEKQIHVLTQAGIPKTQIIADPGIGFGKTLEHNLALLNRISLFHSLGVVILLGASRKRFIGTIGGQKDASQRGAGSLGVALAAVAQGVQIIRAHDVADHTQAIALWQKSVEKS